MTPVEERCATACCVCLKHDAPIDLPETVADSTNDDCALQNSDSNAEGAFMSVSIIAYRQEGINFGVGRRVGAATLSQQALQLGLFDADALNPGRKVQRLPDPAQQHKRMSDNALEPNQSVA